MHRQLMGGAESVSTDFKQGQERSQCAEEEFHHRGTEGTKFLWGTRGHTLGLCGEIFILRDLVARKGPTLADLGAYAKDDGDWVLVSSSLAAPNLKNRARPRTRPRPRLLRYLALENATLFGFR